MESPGEVLVAASAYCAGRSSYLYGTVLFMSLRTTLEKLTRFHTITGELDEAHRCLDWIQQELREVPLHIRTHIHNGFPSLVATTKRTKKPKLWLAGHIDVVPGGDHLFKPRVAHDRMFGRGVFDMKFAVASYIELFKHLGKEVTNYDLGLMLVSDEETGGFNGTKLLLEKDKYRGELAFLPDGGGPWQFEECAKGKMVVRVHTEGVSAHASRPWCGRNAIDELNQAMVDLHAWVKDIRTQERDHWRTTCVLTQISGGAGENIIPSRAEATLDIRVVAASHAIRLEKYFARLERKYPNTRFDICCSEMAYGVRTTNGHAKRFARIAKELYGIECGWTRSHGSSDGRFFAEHGIPALLIYPLAGNAHSEEEWVDLEDLHRYHTVLGQFIQETARDKQV